MVISNLFRDLVNVVQLGSAFTVRLQSCFNSRLNDWNINNLALLSACPLVQIKARYSAHCRISALVLRLCRKVSVMRKMQILNQFEQSLSVHYPKYHLHIHFNLQELIFPSQLLQCVSGCVNCIGASESFVGFFVQILQVFSLNVVILTRNNDFGSSSLYQWIYN